MPVTINGSGSVTGVSADSLSTGLQHITTRSFTGVSSLSVNGCFTSAFENYLCVVNYTRSTTGGNVTLRMRAGGVDTSSGVYDYGFYYIYYGGGGSAATVAAAQTSTTFSGLQGSGAIGVTMSILKPQLAQRTQIGYTFVGEDNSALRNTATGGSTIVDTVQYDGFTLTSSTATITGTLRVYGYMNGVAS
jgi:hypothetical protein